MGKKKLIFIIPAAIVGIVLFMALGGWIVQYLWNWLLPPLFGWRMITFWQALAILVLCRLLFGRWGGGRHGGHGMRNRWRGGMRERMAEKWEQRWAERWEEMTPEEREKFRQGIGRRCGFGEEKPAEGAGA
jgi:MFS family permease